MQNLFTSSEILSNPAAILAITAWSLVWKGLALWRAARNRQKNWFITLLVINSFGILSIVYLLWFAERKRFWDRLPKIKNLWPFRKKTVLSSLQPKAKGFSSHEVKDKIKEAVDH